MSKFAMPKVFGAVTMGERGQIVIPMDIRKVFSIKPGDRLIVFAKENDGPIGLIPAEQFSKFLEHATEMLAKIKKINNAQ
ncbi:MAG: AbrB/MazE/SpoVT family DNA-binding domain-containing protein [Candidatus Omnitrophica bacterium]|nr:AbrB/MazE/SpoVT family DNA-binding domain-containing protein [Candidatus Omnitrophota bacterium]